MGLTRSRGLALAVVAAAFAAFSTVSGAGGVPRVPPASPLVAVAGAALLAPGDELWDTRFALGANDAAYAVAVTPQAVYIGGDFSSVGGVAANRVARWDRVTHRWTALGTGVNNRVLAIAVDGHSVYVGGNLSQAGGATASAIARFDELTQSWSALGSGMAMTGFSPEVDAIAVGTGGVIYAGGWFDTAGGVAASNVASWNGSSWSALGAGVWNSGGATSEVHSITVSGTDVWVGGTFTWAGSNVANNVARWDGAAWQSMGTGVTGTNADVNAVAVSGSAVYVGGDFDTAHNPGGGTVAAASVAVWTGTAWSALGSGVDIDVAAIAVGSDGIYVGGRFSTAGGSTASRIARWDGAAWHALIMSTGLVEGVDSNVYGVAADGQSVFLVGFFLTAGGMDANRVAWWDGAASMWYGLGSAPNGQVNAVAQYGDEVYVGGSFTSAGGVPAAGLAIFNNRTGSWSSVPGGLSGCNGLLCLPTVNAIKMWGNRLVVGGNFTQAGTTAATNIAWLDRATGTWYALGEGLYGCTGLFCTSYVNAISINTDSGLFAGGKFITAGSVTANNVAYWDGAAWSLLTGTPTGSIGVNGVVNALAADGIAGTAIGGSFAWPFDNLAYNAASVEWQPMGQPDGEVDAMAGGDTLIYVGGAFTHVNSTAHSHVVKTTWTTQWNYYTMGSGFDSNVLALDLAGSDVVAGGTFALSGATGVSKVAAYRGSAWQPFGSGVDATVRALSAGTGRVWVGGDFATAGGKDSVHIGRTMLGSLPTALAVDSTGNGVFEPGEMVVVSPAWVHDAAAAVTGTASSFTGPATATYTLSDSAASYGTVTPGVAQDCMAATGNCYSLIVTAATRPATHWDASFIETLSNGASKTWSVHLGGSFSDVTTAYSLYRYVEALLHSGVTQGCTANAYCPANQVSRAQMAMFIARAMAGGEGGVPSLGTVPGKGDYKCTSGGVSLFTDVAPTASYCAHVHLIAARGVTLGCTTTTYCPSTTLTRGQMAMFIARAMAGSDAAVPSYQTEAATARTYSCDASAPSLYFTDMTAASQYCRHVHYLWAKDVIGGCIASPAQFCPASMVTRGQMSKFLVNGFGLQLYGP
jgi:trimeric autotransporter adhesin